MQISKLVSALIVLGSAVVATIPEASDVESVELVAREASANLTELVDPDGNDSPDLVKRSCVGSAWHVTFWNDTCGDGQSAQFCDPAKFNECQIQWEDTAPNYITFGAVNPNYRLSIYSSGPGCIGTPKHVNPGGCRGFKATSAWSWKVWQQ